MSRTTIACFIKLPEPRPCIYISLFLIPFALQGAFYNPLCSPLWHLRLGPVLRDKVETPRTLTPISYTLRPDPKSSSLNSERACGKKPYRPFSLCRALDSVHLQCCPSRKPYTLIAPSMSFLHIYKDLLNQTPKGSHATGTS